MADLVQYFDNFSPLSETAMYELLQHIRTKTVKKGEHLLQSGDVCRHLFFLNKGLAKIYFTREDKEFVMQFFYANRVFSVFESYITQTPSNYALVAIEPTTVTLISRDRMEELCEKHHSAETFYRKLVSVATVRMMKRISEMLNEDATERYNQFVKEHREIIQRINLGDLANYLGITQQSLSRIRAKK
jgi:CRP-like cAMP-binding protein